MSYTSLNRQFVLQLGQNMHSTNPVRWTLGGPVCSMGGPGAQFRANELMYPRRASPPNSRQGAPYRWRRACAHRRIVLAAVRRLADRLLGDGN